MLDDILAVEPKPVLESTMSKNGAVLGPLMSRIVEFPQSNEGPDSRESHCVSGLFTSFGLHFAFAGFGCAGEKAVGSKIRGTC
jgi:hypothetical protein